MFYDDYLYYLFNQFCGTADTYVYKNLLGNVYLKNKW